MKSRSFTKEYEESITYNGIEIAYRYRKSYRKTLGICVRPGLSVTVTAPRGTSSEEIKDFVRQRAKWIVRAQRSLEQRPKRPMHTYENGEVHHFFGKPCPLQISLGRKDSVRCEEGCLMVTSRHVSEPRRTEHLITSWYKKQAVSIFYERLVSWYRKMAGDGVSLPKLRIRQMKSRWGTCSSTGWITLNLSLIKTPSECIDYVIVHELCHLKVKGHGPDFWGLVESVMPDYKQVRKELKAYG